MIATATAIALGIAAASSAGAQVYATKKAGDTNRRSIDAQSKAESDALAATTAEDARRDARYKQESEFRAKSYQEALAADQARWQGYTQMMSPHWNMGLNALGTLTGNEMGPMAMPSGPPPSGGMGAGMPSGPMGLTDLGARGRTSAARRQPRGIQTPSVGSQGQDPLAVVQQLMSLAQLGQRGSGGSPAYAGDPLMPTPGLA